MAWERGEVIETDLIVVQIRKVGNEEKLGIFVLFSRMRIQFWKSLMRFLSQAANENRIQNVSEWF
jgi:hypothetical protein